MALSTPLRDPEQVPNQYPPSASVLAGTARRDITPPDGIYARNWGAAATDIAEGVHRPINATILVIRETRDSAPLVLGSIDGGWWHCPEDEWLVRGPLIEALKLDPARVLLGLTHSHAVPSLSPEDADKPGGHLIAAYLDHLRASLIDATREAMQCMAPAVITWGTGRCALAANRDLPDPRADRVVCGWNPRNPADDTLVVGRVAEKSGRVIATIVNYACHPTTLGWQNLRISPDFVGAMREVVEQATGGAPCLYLQGASGELAPREQYTGDLAVAEANGRCLGHAGAAVINGMLPPAVGLAYVGVIESGAPLAMWERRAFEPSRELAAAMIDVHLPLRPMPSEAQLKRDLADCTDRNTAERLQRKMRVVHGAGDGPSCAVPLWAWCIGDALIVAHPNEAYSDFQMELRRRFPANTLVIANLVNGGQSSYLCPPHLHDLDIYQVWQSPFDRQALPTLIEAGDRAIRSLLHPSHDS